MLLILFTEYYQDMEFIFCSKFISDESVGSAAPVKRFALAYWREAYIIYYQQTPLKGHHCLRKSLLFLICRTLAPCKSAAEVFPGPWRPSTVTARPWVHHQPCCLCPAPPGPSDPAPAMMQWGQSPAPHRPALRSHGRHWAGPRSHPIPVPREMPDTQGWGCLAPHWDDGTGPGWWGSALLCWEVPLSPCTLGSSWPSQHPDSNHYKISTCQTHPKSW